MNDRQRTTNHPGQSSTVRAAIIGMGSWGQNLVNCVQGKSDLIQFVAGATRTPGRAQEFSRRHGIPIRASYEAVLSDPSIDAVVLATPHTMHTEQIMPRAPANMFSPRSRSA
jgi:predicted dehydrogenase